MASLDANVPSLQLFPRVDSLSRIQFASLAADDFLIFIQRSLISSRSLR